MKLKPQNEWVKEYPTDGVAGDRAIMRGLRLRIGEEAYSRVGLGCCYLSEWLHKHQAEHPAIRRAYYELWAWDFHRYSGNYDKACECMKQAGYSGIYWRNNMW